MSLEGDLLVARACPEHSRTRFVRAVNYPECEACGRILQQIAQACSHNREELAKFMTGFKRQLEERLKAQ